MNSNLPAYGPTTVHQDTDTQADVIIRVAYALSREQLLTALAYGYAEIAPDRAPEDLTVDEIRGEVEGFLGSHGVLELDAQTERDRLNPGSLAAQIVVAKLADALNRAYPTDSTMVERPVQAPRYGDGTVTLQTLDHGEITITEPLWCRGHDGEQIVGRVDMTHVGSTVAGKFAGVEFLPARISWGPFAELRPEPYPLADVDEFPGMDPDELRQLAAEVGAHAGRLYRLSNHLERIRRAES